MQGEEPAVGWLWPESTPTALHLAQVICREATDSDAFSSGQMTVNGLHQALPVGCLSDEPKHCSSTTKAPRHQGKAAPITRPSAGTDTEEPCASDRPGLVRENPCPNEAGGALVSCGEIFGMKAILDIGVVSVTSAIAITLLNRIEYAVFAVVYFLAEVPLLLGVVAGYRAWCAPAVQQAGSGRKHPVR